jgi:hypothetical protein
MMGQAIERAFLHLAQPEHFSPFVAGMVPDVYWSIHSPIHLVSTNTWEVGAGRQDTDVDTCPLGDHFQMQFLTSVFNSATFNLVFAVRKKILKCSLLWTHFTHLHWLCWMLTYLIPCWAVSLMPAAYLSCILNPTILPITACLWCSINPVPE